VLDNFTIMITSFFPKKSSTGSKRSRPDGDEGAGGGSSKRVATPADQNSTTTKTKTSSKLTVETSTLLSYLHHHDGGKEVSWRGVLEDYFATAKFSSLASFIAKER